MPLLESYPARNEDYYRDQWRAYYAERQQRLGRLARLVGVAGVLALFFALISESFQERHPLFTTFMAVLGGLLWLAIAIQWFMLNWEMGSWICPRCGDRFFTSTFVRNPFGMRCRHCNLRRLKKSEVQDIS
jgi:DNA-directed RNA polymerase subunit RPC12/RpoP